MARAIIAGCLLGIALLAAAYLAQRYVTIHEVAHEHSGQAAHDRSVFLNRGSSDSVGLIVLAHGGGEEWDAKVVRAVEGLGARLPIAVCFGMAMKRSDYLSAAVDYVEAAGARKIVVIPLFIGQSNEIARHFRYLFRLGESSIWPDVARVEARATLIYRDEISPQNPVITSIMRDYIEEVSKSPAEEKLVIVGHGPTAFRDNLQVEAALASMATSVQHELNISGMFVKNLQDDSKRLREQNVLAIRTMVYEWSKEHSVLVVPFLISGSGAAIQTKLAADLDGLEYVFQAKGLAEHPAFTEYLRSLMEPEN